jgi:hypothetical protein
MQLNEMERKYLVRLTTSTFSDADRYIKAALPTLAKLHAKGLVRRVDLDGGEYAPSDAPDADTFWEITDEGMDAVSRRRA